MKHSSEFAVFIIGLVIGAICAGAMVGASVTDTYRKQAIQRGYAEYVMNPTNGVTQWQWKQ